MRNDSHRFPYSMLRFYAQNPNANARRSMIAYLIHTISTTPLTPFRPLSTTAHPHTSSPPHPQAHQLNSHPAAPQAATHAEAVGAHSSPRHHQNTY